MQNSGCKKFRPLRILLNLLTKRLTTQTALSGNLGSLSISCLPGIMIKKHSRAVIAASVALYIVSISIPGAHATEHSTNDNSVHDANSFAISINDTLPQESPADDSQALISGSTGNGEQELQDGGFSTDEDMVAGQPGQQEQEQSKERGLKGLFGAWSLPISGPLVFIKHKKAAPMQSNELSGSISFSDPYESASQQIDQLLDCALSRDPSTAGLEKAVSHYRKRSQIIIAESKDACNYVIPYRGFGPSSEAGDIITGEKLKVKSRASAEYARQKQIDEVHLKLVSSMMQISMGLGMTDQERGKAVTASGVAALSDLVGEEEAEKARANLVLMASQLSITDEHFQKETWDVQQKQKMHRQILELSLEDDPVIHQIKKHLNKYNHRSKFAMVSSSVVQTLLGAASLTPTFVGPAAKTALVAFVMATGGPEQCKLLKELYLDKRLESRWKVLNEESHMALDNYQLAVLTKNPVLLCYSESLVGQMIGGHHVGEVFGKSLLAKKEAPATL